MKLPNQKTVMGAPMACFWMILAVCVTGIVIGSFYDFAISVRIVSFSCFRNIAFSSLIH